MMYLYQLTIGYKIKFKKKQIFNRKKYLEGF